MAIVTAALTAIGEGFKLFLTLFAARNTAAMQANAKAQTIANIRASVNQHIAAGNLPAVQSDGSL
jgi:hypothetical protein